MSDILYLGLKARQLEDSPAYQPISCVKLTIGGEDANGNPIVCTAGNAKSGRTIETSNPLIWDSTVGNTVAKNILSAVQGYVYQPYTADVALLNPVAEIGDAVEVGDIYSVIADVGTTFSPLMTASVSAPVGGDIDHEYPYESSENREIAQQIQGLKTSFIVENGRIAAEISDIQSTEKGLDKKITSLEMTVDGIHAYTDQEIKTISGGVVHDWAEINFTPEEISSQVSSYFDAAGAADTAYDNALADSKTYTDGKVAPIAGEYTSAINQSAKEIMATVAATETIWDTSELSQTVQNNIVAYGYGMPDRSTASQYNGKYYLDQSSGTLYKSNGSKWVKQSTQLQTIQVTTNSKISVQAGQISSIVEETIPGIQTQVSEIKQTAESISLSVSPTILKNEYGQPINEYGWPVNDPSQYVYTGGTDFTITGEGITATTETVDLHVNAVNIDGTITANSVAANTTITSPYISGGTIQSAKFADPYNVTALTMGNGSWTDGFLWFGPSAGASYPTMANSYFRVRAYNNYVEVDLGGKAFIGTQQDSWKLSLGGTWDFSQAEKVIMPDGTVFE